MNQVTVTAATVDEAVASALKQLNTTKENVTITTIDKGKKGILGIGSRLAIVKVSVKDVAKKESIFERIENIEAEKKQAKVVKVEEPRIEKEQVANEETIEESIERPIVVVDEKKQQEAIKKTEVFIKEVAAKMGAEVETESHKEGKICTIKLTGEKIALLIGKRGQTLNALQYLAQLVANQYSEQYMAIVLDAEDYRKRRNETLEQLAHKMADKALYSKREVALEPMPSYERKVIHAALTEKKHIKTYSTGTEPYRHIVIAYEK